MTENHDHDDFEQHEPEVIHEPEPRGSALATPNAQRGTTARESFGEAALERHAETAMSAMAKAAEAEVQARYIVAMRKPRDMDMVRQKLLRECRRPGFAESARYYLPIGDGIVGPSIRFAEAALHALTNIDIQQVTIYEDDDTRRMRVAVVDLETNVRYARDITITKTVERRKLRKGQTPISVRVNSQGDRLYIVHASESELGAKEGALISKATRTLGLRHLPGHVAEECMNVVSATVRDRDAKDPEAAKKRLVDAFAEIGVSVGDLKTYLGHDLDRCAPAEMEELRLVYGAVRDGMSTWDEALAAKRPDEQGEQEPPEAVKKLKRELEAARTKGGNGKKSKQFEIDLSAPPNAAPDAEEGGEG